MTTPEFEGYDWLPTECADERYPMQLISGQFESSGAQSVRVPAGKIVNNGWGEIGSRHIVGDPLKPVPERLTLAWFSYTEDQFFEGSFDLPHAELTALFRASFRSPLTGQTVTWSKIIVGMGLGGWTCVWVAGSGLVREVASAKLEPAQLDWDRVVNNPDISRSNFIRSKLRARLSDVQLRALAERGPPAPKWPQYSRRARWQLAVEGVQVPLRMFLRSFNGDRSYHEFAKQQPQELDTVPKHLMITWLSSSGRKILTKIALNEAEVFGAFDKAFAAAPDTLTAKLRVELGTRGRVSITVEAKDAKIPLTRSTVELLSLPS